MTTWTRALCLGLLLTACSSKEAPPTPATPETPATEQVATPDEVASFTTPEADPGDADGDADGEGEADGAEAVDAGTEGGPGDGDITTPGTVADGGSCLQASDCASGVCEGEGCDDDSPGVCAPAMRACTRDLRPYCGCDGVTFRTSGSCPGRRYAHKGMCEGDPGKQLPVPAGDGG